MVEDLFVIFGDTTYPSRVPGFHLRSPNFGRRSFFRRKLSRQGNQDSIYGPRIVGEDLFFFFGDDNISTVG